MNVSYMVSLVSKNIDSSRKKKMWKMSKSIDFLRALDYNQELDYVDE
jgi:hypothetical protein